MPDIFQIYLRTYDMKFFKLILNTVGTKKIIETNFIFSKKKLKN